MAPYAIRMFGDPVLRQRAAEVERVDATLARLAEDMIATMYDAPGVGLAAPQVGVQKRLFVYDVGDGTGAHALVNPVIAETRDEWTYEEGCLSMPGLSYDVVRPAEIHITGWDLDGREVSFDADEMEARVLQHELDHLDGVLFIDRLDEATRKEALREWRNRSLVAAVPAPAAAEPVRRRLRLPGRA